MANLKYKNKDSEWKSILSTRGPKGDNADITVNGINSESASFYAPISSGLVGQVLTSKGANQSPQWTNLAVVAGTNSYNDLDNKPTIPTTTEELISGNTSALTSGGAYNAFAQRGIPSGGSAGQVIKKSSATDYDFSWADACIDNLSSTSIMTPLSANQGRVLNEKFNNYVLSSNLYYKNGDIYNIIYKDIRPQLAGALTGSKKQIIFSIVVPKSLQNISSVTVNSLKLNIRAADGGYLGASSYTEGGTDFLNGYSVTAEVAAENVVGIWIVSDTAFDYTNNITLGIDVGELKLTFNS